MAFYGNAANTLIGPGGYNVICISTEGKNMWCYTSIPPCAFTVQARTTVLFTFVQSMLGFTQPCMYWVPGNKGCSLVHTAEFQRLRICGIFRPCFQCAFMVYL
jgi:hypothetical protein